MENTPNPVMIILLLGVTQGVFLAVLLLTKAVNRRANKFLALLILAYSTFIVEQAVSGSQLIDRYPHLIGLAAGTVFLHGPLHFLYARALINPNMASGLRDARHLIPVGIFYLYFLFPFYLTSGAEKLAFVASIEENGLTPALRVASWGVLAHGLFYMTITLKELRKHSTTIAGTFSSIEKINLSWLRTITTLTLMVWILGVFIEILQTFGLNEPVQAGVPLSLTILIYVMGYLGLRQPEIFSDARDVPEHETPDLDKKYKRSGLTEDRAQELHSRLMQLMETERPFLDSTLKLNQLARQARMSPNHLSQVINELSHQNFYDFVNGYRIREAQNMIRNPELSDKTMLAIAFDVGFNSKSAFNSAFKNHAGVTPSQFKRHAN